MSVQSMNVRRKLFGLEHKETLRSMTTVGLAKKLMGCWNEAEELEVQVVETSTRVLGEDPPTTIISTGNLALTYWNKGRWDESKTRSASSGDKYKSARRRASRYANVYGKFSGNV